MATIEKRIKKNGAPSFRVQIRVKDNPVQTATFDKLSDAKKWAQQVETNIRQNKYFKTPEANKHTLNETIDRYIINILPTKHKGKKQRLQQLNWWKKQIGNYLLAEITPALIAEQRDVLAQQQTIRRKIRSPSTVVRYLYNLSHVFTVATKEWGWLENNPISKIMKPKEPRGRIRFLSDDERKRLLTAAKNSRNKDLYLILVLCLSTGARKMEIVGLNWNDVDLSRGIITLHETKNGERRVLPLAGYALELMKEREKNKNKHIELVFPSKRDFMRPLDIRASFNKALKHAEIKNFHFHDLRHSAASYLAMNGASLAEMADILGHKSFQMVKRYAHLSEAHTAEVVTKMNNKIFSF